MEIKDIDAAISVLRTRIEVINDTINGAGDFASYCELLDSFEREKAALSSSIMSLNRWRARLERMDTDLPFY